MYTIDYIPELTINIDNGIAMDLRTSDIIEAPNSRSGARSILIKWHCVYKASKN